MLTSPPSVIPSTDWLPAFLMICPECSASLPANVVRASIGDVILLGHTQTGVFLLVSLFSTTKNRVPSKHDTPQTGPKGGGRRFSKTQGSGRVPLRVHGVIQGCMWEGQRLGRKMAKPGYILLVTLFVRVWALSIFFRGFKRNRKGKATKKKCGGFPENRHPRCWVSPQQQTHGVDLFDWGQSGERKGPGQASREGSKERLQRGFRLGILLACPFARVGTFVAAVAKRNERETTFVGHV